MDPRYDKLYLTSFVLFVFRLLIFLTLFFLPLYLQSMGFAGWEIGLLMGVDSLTSLLTTLPLGISNDLVAPRNLSLISFLILAAVYLLLSKTAMFPVLIILFVLLGTSNTLGQLSLRALIYKTTETKKKGSRFAIMGCAEHSGIAAGGLVGGLLLTKLDYGSLFTLTSVLFILIMPLAVGLPRTVKSIFDPTLYKKELLRRDVVVFAIIMFLYAYHWGAEKTVYTLFLKECLFFSPAQMGWMIFITVMMLAATCLVLGTLLDRKSALLSQLIVAGLCLSAVGTMLLALATTKIQAFLFRAVHEIGDGAFMIFSYVMTSNLFSKSRVGGGSGFIGQVSVLGSFTGSLLSGILFQSFGPRIPMVIAGMVGLVSLYCFFRFRLATNSASENNI